MIHITPDNFKTVPWKNGKGTTQLITSSSDSDDYDWRFSRADVSVDGPFSIFKGKSRILTVIEGDGISLISNESTTQASPFVPVGFSGEIPVEGKLWNGPIKDLNLIYSSKRVKATGTLINGKEKLSLEPNNSRLYGLYCLEGNIRHNSEELFNAGDFALINDAPCSISFNKQGRILFYTLDLIN